MEHPNVKGYDYEKVREKMLRSWGKTTGAVPEKKEKTDDEDQSEKKFFKVKNSNFAHGKHPVCLDKSA